MNNLILILIINAFLASSAHSTKEIKILSDTADDAEAALDSLRLAIITSLNEAAVSYANLSKAIDTAALDTKGITFEEIQKNSKYSLKQIASLLKSDRVESERSVEDFKKFFVDDVASCVDEKSNSTIEYLYTWRTALIGSSLSVVFELESGIIQCGKSDEACLRGVITDIDADANQVPKYILEAVIAVEKDVSQQIADIVACKDETISKIYTHMKPMQ